MHADHPPTPENVTITNTTSRVRIDWDPVTDDNCAMGTISYHVTVTRVEGEPEGDIASSGETSVVVSNLLPNQEYVASVIAWTTVTSCTIASDPAVKNFTPVSSSTILICELKFHHHCSMHDYTDHKLYT